MSVAGKQTLSYLLVSLIPYLWHLLKLDVAIFNKGQRETWQRFYFNAKRVNLSKACIRSGSQYTLLMQADMA